MCGQCVWNSVLTVLLECFVSVLSLVNDNVFTDRICVVVVLLLCVVSVYG